MNQVEKRQYSRIFLLVALVIGGILVLCYALFEQPR